MFGKPSQVANVSTLLDAKKKSSFVILMWSNNRIQRSAVCKSHMLSQWLYRSKSTRPLMRSVGPLQVNGGTDE